MAHRIGWLVALGAGLAVAPGALSEVTVVGNQGPSTQSTPYVVPTAAGVRTVSILTVGESVNPKLNGVTPYRMIGIPDGLGAFDNGDGTFTFLSNHEMGSTSGVARAHGGTGATVSRWTVDRETLRVLNGGDLIRDVMVWNYGTQSWDPSTNTTFQRFCSADLPDPSAFFNPATGKGTRERILLNGEETGGGRALAHVATGPGSGVSYELPRLGRDAWENYVACPFAQDLTIAIGTDDTTPGQVFVYVGTKAATGNEVQRAGLANGTLHAILANNIRTEDRTTGIGVPKGSSAPFTLLALADQSASATNTEAAADLLGATEFLRPEDGSFDPSNPSDFYFVTTDRFDQTKNSTGATVGRSRLWRLRFTDLAAPQSGGTISLLLDGTEPHQMFDNLCVTRSGFVLLQEDVGGASWNGKVWRYSIATGALVEVAHHDTARFGNETTPVTAPFNNDEEATGIIDASAILGTGWFLVADQAHASAGDTELDQFGQFIALFDPACAVAPVFTAAASASPAQPMLGQPVSFAAAASVPGDGVLSYAWDFGDGEIGAGSTTTHAYDEPGVFQATCTVTHAATGLTAQSVVQVEVARPLLRAALSLVLDFAREGKDSLVLKGELAIPSGFTPAGEQVSVDVGGVARSFTLDAKGKGAAGDAVFQLTVRRAGSAVPAQRAKFQMTLKNGSIQGALAPLGLVDGNVQAVLVAVPIEIVFDGATFASTDDLVYSAKAGKKGTGR